MSVCLWKEEVEVSQVEERQAQLRRYCGREKGECVSEGAPSRVLSFEWSNSKTTYSLSTSPQPTTKISPTHHHTFFTASTRSEDHKHDKEDGRSQPSPHIIRRDQALKMASGQRDDQEIAQGRSDSVELEEGKVADEAA